MSATRFKDRNPSKRVKGSQNNNGNPRAKVDVQGEKKATKNGGASPEAFRDQKTANMLQVQRARAYRPGCKKPRVVFSLVNGGEDNMRLLEFFVHDLVVNGRRCKVLRDSAATVDVVHPSYVSSPDFTV